MIQFCIILFQRTYEDKYETEPVPFFGATEKEAVDKLKQYIIDSHEVQYSWEDNEEMERSFANANNLDTISEFFGSHYCYYDVSVHEVV